VIFKFTFVLHCVPGFDPRSVDVGFLVGRVALGQIFFFPRIFRFTSPYHHTSAP